MFLAGYIGLAAAKWVLKDARVPLLPPTGDPNPHQMKVFGKSQSFKPMPHECSIPQHPSDPQGLCLCIDTCGLLLPGAATN